jgi:hypothetical protein
MPSTPEDMSHLLIELSLALNELAQNMSNLSVALENVHLEQASPLRDSTLQSAAEVIDKAKTR